MFNTNQKRNLVRDTIKNGANNLSVLKNGAPDYSVCHRTVSRAPGPYNFESATLENSRARSAIIHQTVRRASGATTLYANDRLCQVNNDEQYCGRSQSSEVRGAPDCPVQVQQDDKQLQRSTAQNPNG
jgi:hypothetical protein